MRSRHITDTSQSLPSSGTLSAHRNAARYLERSPGVVSEIRHIDVAFQCRATALSMPMRSTVGSL